MERRVLPFGKKVRVGNFSVLKYTKVLNRHELKTLRDDMGIAKEYRKYLVRGGLPFIKVEAISGIWAIEFCVGTAVYRLIDEQLCEETLMSFLQLFTGWFTDTAVAGDNEYLDEKNKAMKAYIERSTKAVRETPEEKEADDRVLDEVRQDMEARANIVDMAGHIMEGGEQ